MTVATLFACALDFGEEREGSTEMIGMLTLLASLAVDASTRPFLDIVEEVFKDAALSDPEVWQLLEGEFPEICRRIEADRMTVPRAPRASRPTGSTTPIEETAEK